MRTQQARPENVDDGQTQSANALPGSTVCRSTVLTMRPRAHSSSPTLPQNGTAIEKDTPPSTFTVSFSAGPNSEQQQQQQLTGAGCMTQAPSGKWCEAADRERSRMSSRARCPSQRCESPQSVHCSVCSLKPLSPPTTRSTLPTAQPASPHLAQSKEVVPSLLYG